MSALAQNKDPHGHLSDEELSAAVDGELPRPHLRLVEEHLQRCEICRQRQLDLLRVVEPLRRLQRQAPPPALGQLVMDRVRYQRGQRSWIEAVEDRLPGPVSRQSPVGYSFALVIALAACLFFFADWLERRESPSPTFSVPTVEGAVVDGRAFELTADGIWIQSAVRERAGAAAPRLLLLESAAGQELALRWPGAALLARSGEVVLQDQDGQLVRLKAQGPAEIEKPAAR
ncbi:MAG: zf-HC2 domain-containing protein [Acidobacteriota bacterium]